MFKLVKWAFHLGQQTERQRIEHILINNLRSTNPDEIARVLFRKDVDDLPEKKQGNVMLERGVNYRVNQIIEDITFPRQTETESYSQLYPKGDK